MNHWKYEPTNQSTNQKKPHIDKATLNFQRPVLKLLTITLFCMIMQIENGVGGGEGTKIMKFLGRRWFIPNYITTCSLYSPPQSPSWLLLTGAYCLPQMYFTDVDNYFRTLVCSSLYTSFSSLLEGGCEGGGGILFSFQMHKYIH